MIAIGKTFGTFDFINALCGFKQKWEDWRTYHQCIANSFGFLSLRHFCWKIYPVAIQPCRELPIFRWSRRQWRIFLDFPMNCGRVTFSLTPSLCLPGILAGPGEGVEGSRGFPWPPCGANLQDRLLWTSALQAQQQPSCPGSGPTTLKTSQNRV